MCKNWNGTHGFCFRNGFSVYSIAICSYVTGTKDLVSLFFAYFDMSDNDVKKICHGSKEVNA